MTEFQRPGECRAAQATYNKHQALSERISAHLKGSLPKVCPQEVFDCAGWWLDYMQTGPDKFESQSDHCTRAFLAFAQFLMLTDQQRAAVVKGVTVHKMPYRGDSYDIYVGMVKGKIEDGENPDFRKEAIKKMQSIRIGK